MQGCSDEELMWTWIENPYMQYFCGETHFQHRLPIDPSSMTRWRKRLGARGVEKLLEQTIEAAKNGRVIKERSMERVIVDYRPIHPYSSDNSLNYCLKIGGHYRPLMAQSDLKTSALYSGHLKPVKCSM